MRIIPITIAAVAAISLATVGLRSSGQPAPAAAPSFECRWADTPITLDGSDSDPAWKHAQVIDDFRSWWLPGSPTAKASTRAKLLWDRDNLYFFAEMQDADLFADVTEHDGDTWDNDVFELFFRPSSRHPGYFEFQVNAAGTKFDCFFPKRDLSTVRTQKSVGEFRLESKVKLRGTLNKRDDRDEGWNVEGQIPWVDFLRAGGRPVPGEAWQFALCRYDYLKTQEKPELSTIAPLREKKVGAFFHQYEDYATLRFVGADATTSRPHAIPKLEPVTTSTVKGSPEPPLPYRAKRIYPNLALDKVIQANAIPSTDQLLLILQNAPAGGTALYRITDDPAVKSADLVKLFDTPDAGTAFDFTFHPNFAENGFVYVGWNGPNQNGKVKKKSCRITRFTAKTKPTFTIDTVSAKTIIEWESDGHNGTAVCFGADGMLYVTSGDGTSDSDDDVKGQSTDTLLSKVLRLDVDHPANGKLYSVPTDNPFVADKRFAPETWAYGLRNPWRITSDWKSGQIWVGNNGQDIWETAYLLKKGDNYGWSVMEGSHPFYQTRTPGPTPFTKPTIEHHHAEFRSLTGGLVYRGTQFPELDGAYIYGDYSTGRIWAMKHDGTKPIWHKELAAPRIQISGFGMNRRGELLICDHHPEKDGGGLYTIEPTPPDTKPSTFPRKLSQSGLFDSVKDHRMKPGVIPYSVNAPFWSDGMHKERWMVLPPGETIGFTLKRAWTFPDDTLFVKSFAVEQEEGNVASRKWIETRFLTKQQGEWTGYTYIWNDAGTDAELLPSGGTDKKFSIRTATGVREQTWHYPSRAECMICHSRAAKFVLGLCEHQLSKPHDYGPVVDDQLRVFEHLGLLKGLEWGTLAKETIAERAEAKGLKDKAAEEYVKVHGAQPGQRGIPATTMLPRSPTTMPALADPYDAKADLTKRAKSWLHVNCSSCHIQAGGGNSQMELEFITALDKMRLLDEAPVHTPFDIPNAKLIASGAPDRSVLLKRIGMRGSGQMPPLASTRVDEAGVALMRDWIRSRKPN